MRHLRPPFQVIGKGLRCLNPMQDCAEMTCSVLCRDLCWSRALNKSILVASWWIILPAKDKTTQSCRLSPALDELPSILTLLVLAKPIFESLVIKFLLLPALCPR